VTTSDPNFDSDQVKNVFRLFCGEELKPLAARDAMTIAIYGMAQACAKDIPIAADGELSEWVMGIGKASPAIETESLDELARKCLNAVYRISNQKELLSAVYTLYPNDEWKIGVDVSKVRNYFLEQSGIELAADITAPHLLRVVRVIARCFEILKASPFTLIERARAGHRDDAVLDLVKIDKLFLHDSCTRRVISEAERQEDHLFLQQLSRAVRYPPRSGSKIVVRCLLYILFQLEIELPKYSDFQGWFDAEGKIFPGEYAFEKFVQRCRSEFERLK
jgi:hypothetical protein